jgi:hypothetical protein
MIACFLPASRGCFQVVCDFCHAHLDANKAAFESPKLELIHDDARSQLEQYPGKFDVIIGDLADPLEDGPCYQLYTQASTTHTHSQQPSCPASLAAESVVGGTTNSSGPVAGRS